MIAPRLGAAMILLTAIAYAQQTEHPFNSYSLEKEAGLGAQMAARLRTETVAVESAAVQSYVERTARRLEVHLKSPFPWTIAVVTGLWDGPTHEPVTLPGGYIFVPASLILKAESEDEFAGMLAHAMAHVASRDTTRAASLASLATLGTLPLVFAGGDGRMLPLSYLPMARKIEADADGLALRTMRDAGYNPEALVQYIGRIQPADLGMESPLPPRDDRIRAMEKAIGTLGAMAPKDEFRAVQNELRRLAHSDAPLRKAPSLFK